MKSRFTNKSESKRKHHGTLHLFAQLPFVQRGVITLVNTLMRRMFLKEYVNLPCMIIPDPRSTLCEIGFFGSNIVTAITLSRCPAAEAVRGGIHLADLDLPGSVTVYCCWAEGCSIRPRWLGCQGTQCQTMLPRSGMVGPPKLTLPFEVRYFLVMFYLFVQNASICNSAIYLSQ